MTTDNFELDLQKFGFDAREAKVYLAALDLGPSPVQKIAQRAGIPRATTYLVLDDLHTKGFLTSYNEGKKTYFVAESPVRLGTLVDQREAEIIVQKEAIKKLVPELISRGQFERGERPVVRYYEGAEAIKPFMRDSLHGRGGEILNILHLERAHKTLEQAGFPIEKVRERRAQHRIKSRIIYTSDKGPIANFSTPQRQAKYVPIEKYPFGADIIIRDNKVILTPYGMPLRGVAIEDKDIASSLRMVFELLWQNLE